MGLQILIKMKKLIFPILAIGLVSCETVIDYDGELSEPMIVTAPISLQDDRPRYEGQFGFTPSSSLQEIGLTYSIDILDNGYPQQLDNALVQVREQGGAWIQFDEMISGYYRTNGFQFEEGKTYEYRASRSGYETVTSEFEIPNHVEITDAKFVREVGFDSLSFEDGYSEYEITFTDPGGDQFYSISCILVDQNDTLQASYYVTSSSPFANAISDGEYYAYFSELYSDNALYRGEEVTIPVRVMNLRGEEPPQNLKLAFVLRTHDIHSYRYHSSLQRYQYNGGSGDPFSQPVLVYTNFDGGLGYVGGFSTHLWTE